MKKVLLICLAPMCLMNASVYNRGDCSRVHRLESEVELANKQLDRIASRLERIIDIIKPLECDFPDSEMFNEEDNFEEELK